MPVLGSMWPRIDQKINAGDPVTPCPEAGALAPCHQSSAPAMRAPQTPTPQHSRGHWKLLRQWRPGARLVHAAGLPSPPVPQNLLIPRMLLLLAAAVGTASSRNTPQLQAAAPDLPPVKCITGSRHYRHAAGRAQTTTLHVCLKTAMVHAHAPLGLRMMGLRMT